MARKLTAKQVFDDLMAKHEPELARAFLEAVNDVRSTVQMQRLVAALSAGDIEGALSALNLDEAAFDDLLEALRDAYLDGGKSEASRFPSRAGTFRFGGRNPAAEGWLSGHSADLVTYITSDARDGLRRALMEGLAAGANPQATALNVVGRINRVTGRREGGLIGLSAPQMEFASTARAELASTDPATLRHFLTRKARDRRFDRSIQKALREERPLDPAIAAKAATAYERRLLLQRGRAIALHETFAALAEARDQAHRQLVESGQVAADAVTLTWRHFPKENPRHQHIAMNGVSVKLGQRFVLPDGTTMRFPHDPEAPVNHTAGCGCQADYRVDWLSLAR
jgi:hypothetical protein